MIEKKGQCAIEQVGFLSAWAPAEVDTDRPNVGRMHDYFLGGARNFEADRQLAEKVKKHIPAELFAQMNRAFLGRVVNHLVKEAGIRQFLDLGSGVSPEGNVHEVAQLASPDCTVVYVDNDPVAIAHGELMLEGNDRAVMVGADLRYPYTILSHPDAQRLIDFGEPVAVLACDVLHFVPDDADLMGIVAAYREVVTSGSYLAISHATADDYPDQLAEAVRLYEDTSAPVTPRTHEQICRLFDGFSLVSPGVVYPPLWRPRDADGDDVDPRHSLGYVGLAVL